MECDKKGECKLELDSPTQSESEASAEKAETKECDKSDSCELKVDQSSEQKS